MRLLSIFALVFLISLLLHGGLKDRTMPDKRAGQDAEKVEEVTETVEAADTTELQPIQTEQEDFSSLIFSKPPYPVKHFDFGREYVFSIIEVEIKNLIVNRQNDSFKITNHFCAVGYEFPRNQQAKNKGSARKEVVVYWKEGEMLYRWKGGDPKMADQDFYNARTLTDSLSYPLDPNLSVIGDEENRIGFDDYKARVENVIADCKNHGKLYEIEPFAPPPRGFNRPEGRGHPRRASPATLPAPATPPASSALPAHRSNRPEGGGRHRRASPVPPSAPVPQPAPTTPPTPESPPDPAAPSSSSPPV